ncbi:hypothetical protein COSO111634_08385 [Corallococcus soli]
MATLRPDTQISPTSPGARRSRVSGSTMAICCSRMVWPQPTSVRAPGSLAPTATARCCSSALLDSVINSGGADLRPPEAMSVPSASP